jgi:hypothetical protein
MTVKGVDTVGIAYHAMTVKSVHIVLTATVAVIATIAAFASTASNVAIV